MTLTPLKSGCETDQSVFARLLARTAGPRIKRRSMKRRRVVRQFERTNTPGMFRWNAHRVSNFGGHALP